MRIAIDARKLRDFGIGTYIRNILTELSRLDRDHRVRGAVPPRRPRFRRCPGPEFPHGAGNGADLLGGGAIQDSPVAGARARAAGARAALRAAAAGALPVGGDHPRLHSPDVSAIPAEQAGARLRQGIDVERGAEGRTASSPSRKPRSATSCDSSTSGRRRSSSSTTRSTNASWRRRIRSGWTWCEQRYQLDHPFVLYVGNIKPHKNIERLIDAFGRDPRARLRRRPEAGDHRRRDLEVPGAAAVGAQAQARQARALPRLSADGNAGGVLSPGARVRVSVACTKDSACRRSRRWPAARRW